VVVAAVVEHLETAEKVAQAVAVKALLEPIMVLLELLIPEVVAVEVLMLHQDKVHLAALALSSLKYLTT
jgi:hypothetical protein